MNGNENKSISFGEKEILKKIRSKLHSYQFIDIDPVEYEPLKPHQKIDFLKKLCGFIKKIQIIGIILYFYSK